MQLNRYIPLTLAVCLLLVTTQGCDSKLNVTPGQNLSPDQIKTPADVKAVLFGAYKSMQHYNAFGERYLLIADLLGSAGQVTYKGTVTEYRDVFGKEQVAQSGIAAGIWQQSYVIINSVNVVLQRLDLLDGTERDAIEGEARFVRGITYYELANFFALPYSAGNAAGNDAVPMVLEPITAYDPARDNKPRAKVEEVYNQVIQDLSAAAAKLPASYNDGRGRATRYSALAFLSRVYLAKGDYTAAATAASEVIADGGFSLAPAFDKAFNNISNSTEDLFAIQQNNQSNAGVGDNGLTSMYAAYSQQPSGRGDVQVDTTGMLPLYREGDARGAFMYSGTSIAGSPGVFTGKWKDYYKVIPLARLAEMYLTRAEANARQGSAIGGKTPLEDVNVVRRRSNADTLPAVTAAQVVEERFRELAFEGDWLWTRKRLKMNVGNKRYDDPRLVLPVPQRERDVNKQLTQNEGYDN
jgi:hypothetical protein